jgi:hypothetical protein
MQVLVAREHVAPETAVELGQVGVSQRVAQCSRAGAALEQRRPQERAESLAKAAFAGLDEEAHPEVCVRGDGPPERVVLRPSSLGGRRARLHRSPRLVRRAQGDGFRQRQQIDRALARVLHDARKPFDRTALGGLERGGAVSRDRAARDVAADALEEPERRRIAARPAIVRVQERSGEGGELGEALLLRRGAAAAFVERHRHPEAPVVARAAARARARLDRSRVIEVVAGRLQHAHRVGRPIRAAREVIGLGQRRAEHVADPREGRRVGGEHLALESRALDLRLVHPEHELGARAVLAQPDSREVAVRLQPVAQLGREAVGGKRHLVGVLWRLLDRKRNWQHGQRRERELGEPHRRPGG